MSEIKNSDFLVALLKRARSVMIENHGKVLSAEYVIITALGYCTVDPGSKWRDLLSDTMREESTRMILLLNQRFPNPKATIVFPRPGGPASTTLPCESSQVSSLRESMCPCVIPDSSSDGSNSSIALTCGGKWAAA